MKQDLTIEIDSKTSDVSLACICINSLYRYYGVPRLLCYQVELCVDEILNNIIEHDLKFEEGNPIRLNTVFQTDLASVVITYKSKQNDLGPWKEFREPPDAKDLPERGFGCFLVREIMDEVLYERIDGFNVFSLKKRLALDFNFSQRARQVGGPPSA